jgi:hypothetical protein
MFQPTDPVTITLNAQEWDQIIGLLAEHPYKLSARFINKISGQAQRSKAGQTMPLPNGSALHPALEN